MLKRTVAYLPAHILQYKI